MGKFIDMTGWIMKEHGFPDSRLTVVERLPDNLCPAKKPRGKRTMWVCECECGNTTIVDATYLRDGQILSCGCLHKEMLGNRSRKHGLHDTRLYRVWNSMKRRCYSVNDESYKSYGGRGVKVCDEWHDFKNFYNWAYANGYDENAEYGQCTIDRINVNGNYEPANCRWVSNTVQCRNKTTSNIVTFNGVSKNVADWKAETGLPVDQRLCKGWSIEDALTKPIHYRHAKEKD